MHRVVLVNPHHRNHHHMLFPPAFPRPQSLNARPHKLLRTARRTCQRTPFEREVLSRPRTVPTERHPWHAGYDQSREASYPDVRSKTLDKSPVPRSRLRQADIVGAHCGHIDAPVVCLPNKLRP
jgi:hypothetical protein